MANLTDRELKKIHNFYYIKEMSAPEIANKFKVSLDAVYYFMRRHNLTRRNYSDQNKIRFKKKSPSFSAKTKLSANEKELVIAGAMLYWGEGSQSDNADIVDLANSKPEIISIFLKFLRTIYNINETKLRAYLYCYSNQNPKKLINFWEKLTKIPKRQFTKPYIRKDFKPEKSGKMKHGLLHVRYYDKKLLNTIRETIKKYINKFA